MYMAKKRLTRAQKQRRNDRRQNTIQRTRPKTVLAPQKIAVEPSEFVQASLSSDTLRNSVILAAGLIVLQLFIWGIFSLTRFDTKLFELINL